MIFRNLISCVFCISLLFACKPEPPILPLGEFEKGVFISNEGIYNQTSGTITHRAEDGTIHQKIFKTVNGRDLGNVVQSLCFHQDRVFIVVNNSNKIEVAEAATFKELAQINSLEQPRYFLAINDSMAYVSQWGNDLLSGSIALVNLKTYQVVQTIRQGIGKGPERMLLENGKVWVANVGGLEIDNFISILDVNTHQVVDTIRVNDAPNSLQLAGDGLVWVACSGKTVYSSYPNIDTVASTAGALLGVNPANRQIQKQFLFPKGQGASALSVKQNSLYYRTATEVNSYNISSQQNSIVLHGAFYGLGLDVQNNYLYAARYTGIQATWVLRYDLATQAVVDSFQAGVFANNFYFK